MPARSDFRDLETLRAKMAQLAEPGFRAHLATNLGEEALKLLDDEFRQGRDPYGTAWAPLTSRVGQPLRNTGAHLQDSLHCTADERGFTVETAFVGAAVHQYGATIVPRNAKALAFRVRGAPTASRPRGKLSGVVFAESVTIPRRQYMPEGEAGPIWSKGLEGAADDVMRKHFGASP